MVQLKADLINGNDATLTVEGWTFNRTAIVYGLTGYVGYAKLVAATNYLQMQGAYINLPHPAWPTAYCRQISPVAISNDTIEFTLIYKENAPVQVSCNTSLSQESTNIGYETPLSTETKTIQLEYTYPTDYVDPNTGATSSLAGKTVKQGGTVMKYIPEISFSVSRTETIIGEQLVEKQKTYVGKINSFAWSWINSPVIQPIYSWLCTGITGVSNDGGLTFEVTYSFAFREETWNPYIVFTRVDGNPASDVGTKENILQPLAFKQVYIYRAVNFNPLGI